MSEAGESHLVHRYHCLDDSWSYVAIEMHIEKLSTREKYIIYNYCFCYLTFMKPDYYHVLENFVL